MNWLENEMKLPKKIKKWKDSVNENSVKSLKYKVLWDIFGLELAY